MQEAVARKPGRPRKELHTGDIKIEQKAPIENREDLDGEVIEASQDVLDRDYLNRLAFNEEPVTIRIEPGREKNSPRDIFCSVNGKGAEILVGGKWATWNNGYLPVATVLTVKRKYVEVLLRMKHDEVATEVRDRESERPLNMLTRDTSPVANMTIIRDDNPRGVDWATEIRSRRA